MHINQTIHFESSQQRKKRGISAPGLNNFYKIPVSCRVNFSDNKFIIKLVKNRRARYIAASAGEEKTMKKCPADQMSVNVQAALFFIVIATRQLLHPGLLLRLYLLSVATMTLWGCQGNTRDDFARLSEAMQASRITTPYHQHLVLSQPSPDSSTRIHVYIEGDGRPWIKRYLIAKDPTPRAPLTLALMRQDPQPAIFLGRPCYFNNPFYGLADSHCESRLWTNARYSETVIASMVDALRQWLATQDYSQVTLIGYSGGGTIATLMAQRMPEVTRLVTIAANLDVDAWTRHHHYSPLSGSLNPAELTNTRPRVQYHFFGSKDQVVPPLLARDWLQAQGHPPQVIEGFDHRCCWQQQWPALLELIGAR